jgi:glutathione S-transferase
MGKRGGHPMHRGFERGRVRHSKGLDEDDPYLQADLYLTKRIGEMLERHYAGHPWLVEVSHAQGVAMISLPVLMGDRKYVAHLYALKSDPNLLIMKRFAGEILERYKIHRGKFDATQFVDALTAIPPWKRARNGHVPA